MKQTSKGHFGASLGALSFSLIIHIVLFFILSGVVIFQAVIPKQGFLLSDADVFSQGEQIFTDDMDMIELEEPTLDPILPQNNDLTVEPPDTAPVYTNMTNIIKTQIAQSTTTIEAIPQDAIPTMDPANITQTTNQFNDSVVKRVSNDRVVANLFGAEIAANLLGVIVDISFSTHAVIQVPLEEIDKNFPDALIVLSPGCGMDPKQKGDTYPVKQFEDDIWLKKRYEIESRKYKKLQEKDEDLYKSKEGYFKFNIHQFLVELLDKNKDFDRFYKKAKREGRLYIQNSVLIENEELQEKARIAGTQGAFRFLMEQGVDSIYWFADFDDIVNDKVAEELMNDLSKDDVIVYCHDFRDPNITKANRPHSKIINDFTKNSGGTFIYKTIEAD
ncbi:MAG: hypothetical protein AAF984_08540 [Verrucomicrobiota bacterium]